MVLAIGLGSWLYHPNWLSYAIRQGACYITGKKFNWHGGLRVTKRQSFDDDGRGVGGYGNRPTGVLSFCAVVCRAVRSSDVAIVVWPRISNRQIVGMEPKQSHACPISKKNCLDSVLWKLHCGGSHGCAPSILTPAGLMVWVNHC